MRRARRSRPSRKKVLDKHKKMVEAISGHPETVFLAKDDYPEIWAYVEKRFPALAHKLAHAVLYQNTNMYFLRKAGFPGNAAGLFVPSMAAIIVAHSKFPEEVVVLHELLHYISRLCGSSGTHGDFEERIAYGKSIPYLMSRGYDEKWICECYLLPYFESLRNRLGGKISPTRDVALLQAKSFMQQCLCDIDKSA